MASRCKFSNRSHGARCGPLAVWAALPLLANTGAARADEPGVPACPPAPTSASQPRPASNSVRLVTGAPYSAMGTSETVLTDREGNRVVRQNSVRVWRDSDGRTRTEYELTSVGGPTPVEINSRLTVIDDPTTGERYMLQPDGKVVTVPIAPCRVAGEPDVTVGPPRPARLPMKVSQPVRLGVRKVNGETVTGSRVEATIPAGAMGNEQPVKMSAEQWYGKDLQVVVEATYRDPRTGETKYKLREIQRNEPDASLFRPDPVANPMALPQPKK